MQTFLPYVYDFKQTARVLDNKRLNKQLLEGRQIYAALTGRSSGWVNHPATRMWAGHENMLVEYLKAIKNECDRRGIKTDKNWDAILEMHDANWDRGDAITIPYWMRNDIQAMQIMVTHRGNLYKKDPIYYHEFEQDFKEYRDYICCESCNYFWVTHTYEKNFSYA